MSLYAIFHPFNAFVELHFVPLGLGPCIVYASMSFGVLFSSCLATDLGVAEAHSFWFKSIFALSMPLYSIALSMPHCRMIDHCIVHALFISLCMLVLRCIVYAKYHVH